MSEPHPPHGPTGRGDDPGNHASQAPGYLYGPPGALQAGGGTGGAGGAGGTGGAYGSPQPGQGFPPGYGHAPHQAGWGGPAYGHPAPGAPYGFDFHGRPYSSQTRLIAGLLQLFLGVFGTGRWYTGHFGMAVAQLLTCGGLGIWAIVDGIYLLAAPNVTDSGGRPLRNGS